MFNNPFFFFENRALQDYIMWKKEKIIRAGHAAKLQYNIAHELCMLDN
jgi:hypothetical protein